MVSKMTKNVVENIRERREALGLNKRQLSILAGLSENYVQRLEGGQFADPRYSKVEKLQKALDEAEVPADV